MDAYSIYSEANRTALLATSLILIFAIAVIDVVTPSFPLGYLYLLPILLVSGFLDREWIAIIVLLCAFLTSALSRYEFKQAVVLFLMALTAFGGTGFFVSEVVLNRQKALDYIRKMETEIRLRRETEDQLHGLVQSSPLAIVTIGTNGEILLANDAAQNLFAPGGAPIPGQAIAQFLPALRSVMQQSRSHLFRTRIRCRGQRKGGEMFLATVWFSTSLTAVGPIVSAIIVDFSEDAQDREDLSLEHLLKNAKILVGAISHEIRNLCGAVLVVFKNLSRVPELSRNEDFNALGALIGGLEKLSLMELKPSSFQDLGAVELFSVLDEFRVIVEHACRESGIKVLWNVQETLPLVTGDRYGMQQVFLNLTRNSQRAMETTPRKELTISSEVNPASVVLRFEDTGVGVSDPSQLFRPFNEPGATGLGLYISRAILRSFHGDLQHEERVEGCSFAVTLERFVSSEDDVA